MSKGASLWTLRELPRRQVGTHEVFATRPCCGPDGVGPCLSKAEGLPCGVVELPKRVPLDPAAEERAEGLRRLRIGLGLGLRAASSGLGLTPVELSALERAEADVDDWDALRADLRALREARDA